jgi:DNA-binding beta-propeller fold protein YncE
MMCAMLRRAWESLKATAYVFGIFAMVAVGFWVFVLIVALVSVAVSDETLTRGDLEDLALYLGVSLALLAVVAVVVGVIGTIGELRSARRLSERPLERPWAVTAAPDGTMYVGEPDRRRLTRVDGDELVELHAVMLGHAAPAPYGAVAHDGGGVYVTDPLQALALLVPTEGKPSAVPLAVSGDAARERRPLAIALDADGSLLVADAGLGRLVRVRGDTVEVVAELEAGIRGVAVLADGRIVITDTFGHRVLAVQPNGKLTPFAGTGERGRSDDGRPARASALAGPTGLAAAPDGSLFVADTANDRVVVVATDGTVWTVADEAELSSPRGLAYADGRLFIADTGNDRICVVDADGTIATVLG